MRLMGGVGWVNVKQLGEGFASRNECSEIDGNYLQGPGLSYRDSSCLVLSVCYESKEQTPRLSPEASQCEWI